MRLAPALFVLLTGSAVVAAACTVKEGDPDDGEGGSGNTGNTTTTSDGGSGGMPGTGGMGGMGGGLSCEEQCAEAVPSTSVDLWLEMVGCTYCYACFDSCDGGTGNICDAGMEGPNGCSANNANCIDCVNTDCAQLDTCGAEVDACLADEGCVEFNTCYGNCP